MNYEKWKPWAPAIFFAALGLAMLVVCLCKYGPVPLLILQFLSCMAAPFAVPVLGLLTKRQFSPSLTFNLGVLVVFGMFLERTFGIYDLFPPYDKILHTNFGFIGAAMVYALMLRWKGDKMSTAGVIFTLIMVCLGLGGAWELFEYTSALFTGQDPQVWHGAVDASIAAGKIVENPLTDTMQDMMVTVIGAAAFSLLYLTDAYFGGKYFPRWFGEPRAKDHLEDKIDG